MSLENLTEEEKERLELYKASRPYASVKNKKVTKKRKPFWKKTGFYASVLVILPFIILSAISVLIIGVSQTTDIDALILITQEESTQGVLDSTTGNTIPQWLTIGAWLRDNIGIVIFSVMGFFFFCAAVLLFISGSLNKNKTTINSKDLNNYDEQR